jgi:cytochrome c oxidase subunit 2
MKKKHWLMVLVALASVFAASVMYRLGGGNDTASAKLESATTSGMVLAFEKGCIACHTLDGTAGIGPTWKGTYGTLRTTNDGLQILADDVYLERSIREPAAEVVKGFENIMIAPDLSEAELAELLQLIKELGTAGPE